MYVGSYVLAGVGVVAEKDEGEAARVSDKKKSKRIVTIARVHDGAEGLLVTEATVKFQQKHEHKVWV